jgi:hypothetical protein
MRGIIILEGADGVGKTFLARHLVQKYGAFYIHNGLWPNMWERHTAAARLAIKKQAKQLVVIDRLWLSEQIYGQVFRGGPAYDLGARCLDRAMLRYGALTVLCVRKNLRKHLAHFEELKAMRSEKFMTMARVSQFYYDLLHGNVAHPGDTYVDQLVRFQDYRRRHDVLSYDMDQESPETAAAALVARVDTLRYQALPGQHDPFLSNFSGNDTGRYLFVGQELSPRACQWSPPFFWNDELSSATWLNRSLHNLKFNETLAMWTNAWAPADFLPKVRDLRPDITAITFGTSAYDRMRQLGFSPNKVRGLPHPQWARRFQARKPEIFIDLLREALAS